MQKSKLGIRVTLLAAIVYMVACFGGYVAAIVVAGYILLREENVWLKKIAVRSVAVLILFSLLSWILSMASSLCSFLNDSELYSIVTMITTALSFIKGIVLVFLALMAANEKDAKLPIVDGLLKNIFE